MESILLSKRDIESLVTMRNVVEIVEKTMKGTGEGTVINPSKVTLDLGEVSPWPPYAGFVNAMPAYVGWLDVAGIKWVGGFSKNPAQGLPFITGMILLMNPRNGQFLCVAEGGLITGLRTGAQTAVALKHLRPEKSVRLGLYGSGTQGRFVTSAISECASIKELRVFDIDPRAAEKFAQDVAGTVAGRIVIVDRPEDAADADAVIAFTPAKDKFIRNSWIRPGTIVFPLGSYQECEDEFILGADTIVVDHVGQSLHRGPMKELAEKGKVGEESIYGTIGEIIAGTKPAPSLTGGKRIMCSLIGMGSLDVAVAAVAYRKALERGIGGTFSFT
jgi:alanine dehydrogenase